MQMVSCVINRCVIPFMKRISDISLQLLFWAIFGGDHSLLDCERFGVESFIKYPVLKDS